LLALPSPSPRRRWYPILTLTLTRRNYYTLASPGADAVCFSLVSPLRRGAVVADRGIFIIAGKIKGNKSTPASGGTGINFGVSPNASTMQVNILTMWLQGMHQRRLKKLHQLPVASTARKMTSSVTASTTSKCQDLSTFLPFLVTPLMAAIMRSPALQLLMIHGVF
jgi:hypothetical protein